MKQMKSLLVILVVLSMAGFASARTRGKSDGLKGTISQLGGNSFVLTTKDKLLKVVCDSNTKFMSGGKPVAASEMKEGITVAVMGSTLGQDGIQASTVTIESTKTKAKSK